LPKVREEGIENAKEVKGREEIMSVAKFLNSVLGMA